MKYVIQHHITANSHFDFMIDNGESLDTWQIHESDILPLMSGEPVITKLIQPHRRDYLEYEGPVSRGRGRVEIYDTGKYNVIFREKDLILLNLRGNKLSGKIEIKKTSGSSWKIFFSKFDE